MVQGRMAMWLSKAASLLLAASGVVHEQCKDPLFETHWHGKNDIQTLSEYPGMNSNLKICRAYNEKVSCCHETFEEEQQKYYNFWNRLISKKLMRVAANREAVRAAGQSSTASQRRVDREQYQLVLARYDDIFRQEVQAECFSSLFTYIAGMICFGCKPEWYHFTLLSGSTLSGERVVRVNMARSVCNELWGSCTPFSNAVSALRVALQYSDIARSAARAEEDLGMFLGQQELCDWMHNEVALHPFRLPTREEDRGVPLDVGSYSSRMLMERKLEAVEELDVMLEGRQSQFDQVWRGVPGLTSAARKHGSLQAAVLLALSCRLSALLYFAHGG